VTAPLVARTTATKGDLDMKHSKRILLLLVATALCACTGGSSFSGTDKKSTKQAAPAAAEPAATRPAVDPASRPPSLGKNDTPIPEEGAAEPDSEVPTEAVKKGSFTVWSEPSDPAPYQDYVVVIRVDLPETISTYELTDLTGTLRGTDDYDQMLGRGGRPHDQEFSFSKGRAELRVDVPGSWRHVRDTIHIRSDVLMEEEEIVIEF